MTNSTINKPARADVRAEVNVGNGDASGGASAAGARQAPTEGRMDRIARRAHEIYERRGGEHGKAIEDWLQAEREIDAETED